jgi:hypothetical protein
MNIKKFLVFLFIFVVITVNLGSCRDPEDTGLLILAVEHLDAAGSDLEGLSDIQLSIKRMDVVLRSDPNDPSTEKVVTIDEEERTVILTGIAERVPRQIARVYVPVGYVYQIRLVAVDEESIFIAIKGEPSFVKLPSGPQTGLKIVPDDGKPFEIKKDERTGVKVIFNPAYQINHNNGVGYIMHPVIKAEHADPDKLFPMFHDRIIVRFKDNVSRTQVDSLNAEKDVIVQSVFRKKNYYTMKLPASLTVEDAIRFYREKDIVKYALPVLIYFSQEAGLKRTSIAQLVVCTNLVKEKTLRNYTIN